MKHEDAPESLVNPQWFAFYKDLWDKTGAVHGQNAYAAANALNQGNYTQQMQLAQSAQSALNDQRIVMQAVTPGMWCDADVAVMKERIATLEAERNAAYRTIAELSRRPTLGTVLALEALVANLRAALADAQAKIAPPSTPAAVTKVTKPPIPARALRFSV